MKDIVKIISESAVAGSQGWTVEIIFPDTLRYSEEGKTIQLALEDRPDSVGELEWIIYTPEHWLWSDDREHPIAREKIAEILKRIDLAFWKLDMTILEVV